jgi:hypothetical protein
LETNEKQDSHDLSLIAAAEKAMTGTLGGAVKLGASTMRDQRYRSLMLRCPVQKAPPGTSASVILKCITSNEGKPYDPEDTQAFGSPTRLFNEWAGAQFLDSLGLKPRLSPRFYGGDRELGLVVLEDLGDGECLADVLQGDDANRAEAFLFTYVTTLGRMHAATAGKEAEFLRLRDGLSPRAETERSRIGDWLTDELPKFRAACQTLGVELASGFDADIATITEIIEDPGPFLAFTPGDSCPDNHRILPDGMRLFDFEWCEYRHALSDIVYTRVPFPTCWCVNRLPADLPDRLEAAYRAELVKGCPEAADDALFFKALVAMCGYWTTRTLGWSLAGALEKDESWGISSMRPRALLRLDTLIVASEQFGHLPALATTASHLVMKLRSLWPPETEMPLYPPFRPPA